MEVGVTHPHNHKQVKPLELQQDLQGTWPKHRAPVGAAPPKSMEAGSSSVSVAQPLPQCVQKILDLNWYLERLIFLQLGLRTKGLVLLSSIFCHLYEISFIFLNKIFILFIYLPLFSMLYAAISDWRPRAKLSGLLQWQLEMKRKF